MDEGARGKFRRGVAGEIGLVFAGNSERIRVGGKIWGRGSDRARGITAWEKLCVETKLAWEDSACKKNTAWAGIPCEGGAVWEGANFCRCFSCNFFCKEISKEICKRI